MTKAKLPTHEERLEATRRKMAFKEAMKHAHEVPAAPGAEETPEPEFDGVHCPICGAEVIHESSCLRCPNWDWSKC